MNLSYISGIPVSGNDPSADQPNMTINTNSINIWPTVDHYGYNNNYGGYHNIIHQPAVSGSPTTIQNVHQIYPKAVTPAYSGAPSQVQLFTKSAYTGSSSSAPESQLTGYIRNFSSSSPFSNGWQWIGGVMLQWGFVPISSGNPRTGTVTFTASSQGVPFNNNLMSVQTTLTAPTAAQPSSPSTIYVDPASFSTTGFKWAGNSSNFSSNCNGFIWLAIGY